jgi:hypothetical protein
VFHRLALHYTHLEDPSLKKCTRFQGNRCKKWGNVKKKMVGMARFELATSAPPVEPEVNDRVFDASFYPCK